MAARVFRGLVSLKKRRFVDHDDDFDLDLTYITKHLIAMGFPCLEGTLEAVYRNPMPEVQRFFSTRHADAFKIYNLCAERAYDLTEHFPLVRRFPFCDHNCPRLHQLVEFCHDVDAFVARDPERRVVAVHCKAGKGRTGLFVATYLLHSSAASSAAEAIQMFGARRTFDGKGLTIPSQQRYVYYFEQLMQRGWLPAPGQPSVGVVPERVYALRHVRVLAPPQLDAAHPCAWRFDVTMKRRVGADWADQRVWSLGADGAQTWTADGDQLDFDLRARDLVVFGDVKLDFFVNDKKLFRFWFNTAFVDSHSYLRFSKRAVDHQKSGFMRSEKAASKFSDDFGVELFFLRRHHSTTLPGVDDEGPMEAFLDDSESDGTGSESESEADEELPMGAPAEDLPLGSPG